MVSIKQSPATTTDSKSSLILWPALTSNFKLSLSSLETTASTICNRVQEWMVRLTEWGSWPTRDHTGTYARALLAAVAVVRLRIIPRVLSMRSPCRSRTSFSSSPSNAHSDHLPSSAPPKMYCNIFDSIFDLASSVHRPLWCLGVYCCQHAHTGLLLGSAQGLCQPWCHARRSGQSDWPNFPGFFRPHFVRFWVFLMVISHIFHISYVDIFLVHLSCFPHLYPSHFPELPFPSMTASSRNATFDFRFESFSVSSGFHF